MIAKMTGARASSAAGSTARARHLWTLAGSVLLVAIFLCGSAFAQVCDSAADQCNTGMCVDGKCQAVPVQDGTPCTGPTTTCASSYTCQGGTCTPTSANDGMPCTPDNVCATSGICANGICQGITFVPTGTACVPFPDFGNCYPGTCMFSVCVPTNPLNCQSGDPCVYGYCDPNTGQCTSFPKCFPGNPCQGTTCTNGTCNNINEGGSCDDGNVCTSDDTCHNGDCMGTAGGVVGTPTFTPIVKPTATPSPSPTVVTAAPCVGDCDNSTDVSINEVVKCVNIYLGTAALSTCPNADQDGDGIVKINEVVQAVNSFLDAANCPRVAADTFNPGGE